MKKTMLLKKYFPSFIKTVITFFVVFGIFHYFHLNYSIGLDCQNIKSLNYSLYLIKKNQYIAFRTDERMSLYFPAGKIFIKKVVAKKGDIITTIGNKFFVNGKFVAEAIDYDLDGKPVKHVTFNNYELKAGEYFVLGTNKFSYDSRYWGLVYSNQIIGYAQPIF